MYKASKSNPLHSKALEFASKIKNNKPESELLEEFEKMPHELQKYIATTHMLVPENVTGSNSALAICVNRGYEKICIKLLELGSDIYCPESSKCWGYIIHDSQQTVAKKAIELYGLKAVVVNDQNIWVRCLGRMKEALIYGSTRKAYFLKLISDQIIANLGDLEDSDRKIWVAQAAVVAQEFLTTLSEEDLKYAMAGEHFRAILELNLATLSEQLKCSESDSQASAFKI